MYKQCVSYVDTRNFKVQDAYKIQGFTLQGFKDRATEVNNYASRLTKTKMKVSNKVGTSNQV